MYYAFAHFLPLTQTTPRCHYIKIHTVGIITVINICSHKYHININTTWFQRVSVSVLLWLEVMGQNQYTTIQGGNDGDGSGGDVGDDDDG